MRAIRRLLIATGVLAVTATAGAQLGASGDRELQRVVFAHRHGARTPVMNVNGSCDALGCGTLTDQGALMLKRLGEHFRDSYGTILPSFYDTRVINTVSDESTRVIQSASAFIEGLFAFNSSVPVYPATHTTAAQLIRLWHNPGFSLHTAALQVEIVFNMTKASDAIISRAELAAVGAEMGIPAIECEIVPFACVAQEVDFLLSMHAMGKLAHYPVGAKYLPQLREVRDLFFHMVESQYDMTVKKDGFFKKLGFPGGLLLQSMLAMAGYDGVVLQEYSGHDTTIMPLLVALGLYDFVYPAFGAAVVFEVCTGYNATSNRGLLQSTAGEEDADGLASMFTAASQHRPPARVSAGSGASFFIRALYGMPEQSPGTHDYTWTALNLTCIAANGDSYRTADGCPLADLQRYADTVSPTDLCATWPEDLLTSLCDPVLFPGAPKAGSACAGYRQACPFVACGAGHYVTANYSCAAL